MRCVKGRAIGEHRGTGRVAEPRTLFKSGERANFARFTGLSATCALHGCPSIIDLYVAYALRKFNCSCH